MAHGPVTASLSARVVSFHPDVTRMIRSPADVLVEW
jgi:hypothetical protein